MLAQVLLLSLSVFGLALGHGSLQLPQPRDIVQVHASSFRGGSLFLPSSFFFLRSPFFLFSLLSSRGPSLTASRPERGRAEPGHGRPRSRRPGGPGFYLSRIGSGSLAGDADGRPAGDPRHQPAGAGAACGRLRSLPQPQFGRRRSGAANDRLVQNCIIAR